MKKKYIFRFLLIIGTIMILCGIGISLYPSITSYLSTADSDKYLDVLDKQIENNISFQKKEAKKQDDTAKTKKLSNKDLYKGASKEVREILKRQNLIGIISIEKLDIRFPIAEGTTRDNIRSSIGHLENSSPIELRGGNCVLAGHRGGIYGEFFKNIHKLKQGDIVKVVTLDGTVYKYAKCSSKIIEPNQVAEACKLFPNDTVLTLLSCADNGTKRLIVRCRLIYVKSPTDEAEIY